MPEKTLFVSRPLLNAADLIAWAKQAGFATTMPAAQMHVTLAYSKTPFDWGGQWPEEWELRVPPGQDRAIRPLGDGGAVVLRFRSRELEDRWRWLVDQGASWDHDGFTPHVTISWQAEGAPIRDMVPYSGALHFGGEVWREIKQEFTPPKEKRAMRDGMEQINRIAKVDDSLGIVFGWAIICKVDGQPYYDLQGDHIPEDSMLKAAAEFMASERIGGEMHARDGEGNPIAKGRVLFAYPVTDEIIKTHGITSRTTGLLLGFKPDDAGVLAKFRDGEFKGFSIGGRVIKSEAA